MIDKFAGLVFLGPSWGHGFPNEMKRTFTAELNDEGKYEDLEIVLLLDLLHSVGIRDRLLHFLDPARGPGVQGASSSVLQQLHFSQPN